MKKMDRARRGLAPIHLAVAIVMALVGLSGCTTLDQAAIAEPVPTVTIQSNADSDISPAQSARLTETPIAETDVAEVADVPEATSDVPDTQDSSVSQTNESKIEVGDGDDEGKGDADMGTLADQVRQFIDAQMQGVTQGVSGANSLSLMVTGGASEAEVTARVKTAPSASCSIAVEASGGEGVTLDPPTKTAGEDGSVSWTWRMPRGSGTSTVTVTCDGSKMSSRITIG